MKKHKVDLTAEERQTLETIVHKGTHSSLKLMRAHILLKADSTGPGGQMGALPRRSGATRKPSTMFANVLRRAGGSQPWNVNPKAAPLTCENLMGKARHVS